MNFGLLTVASLFAGGLACASAPETISALTAADIMRVLSICGLQNQFVAQGEKTLSLLWITRQRGPRSRNLELAVHSRNALRSATRADAESEAAKSRSAPA